LNTKSDSPPSSDSTKHRVSDASEVSVESTKKEKKVSFSDSLNDVAGTSGLKDSPLKAKKLSADSKNGVSTGPAHSPSNDSKSNDASVDQADSVPMGDVVDLNNPVTSNGDSSAMVTSPLISVPSAVTSFIEKPLSIVKELSILFWALSCLSFVLSLVMIAVAFVMVGFLLLSSTLFKLHKYAYTALYMDNGDIALMMLLIYSFPSFCKSMVPWVPSFGITFFWYSMMMHFLVVCGRNSDRVRWASYCIPFLAIMETLSLCNNPITQMNGGQLIAVSFLVVSLQYFSIISTLFIGSMSLILFISTAFDGSSILVQWLLILLTLVSFRTMSILRKQSEEVLWSAKESNNSGYKDSVVKGSGVDKNLVCSNDGEVPHF
jgi:hypothetical protein